MIQLLKPENFHTQRNNENDPHNTCGNTTLANLIEAAGVWRYQLDGEQLEDTIYRVLRQPICQAYCVERYPKYVNYPERVADMLAFVGTHMTGRQWTHRSIGSVVQVAKMIERGHAIGVLGSFYHGNLHYVAVTGMDGRDFIIADPYGDFTQDYRIKKGYGIKCPAALLNKLWTGDIVYMEECNI